MKMLPGDTLNSPVPAPVAKETHPVVISGQYVTVALIGAGIALFLSHLVSMAAYVFAILVPLGMLGYGDLLMRRAWRINKAPHIESRSGMDTTYEMANATQFLGGITLFAVGLIYFGIVWYQVTHTLLHWF